MNERVTVQQVDSAEMWRIASCQAVYNGLEMGKIIVPIRACNEVENHNTSNQSNKKTSTTPSCGGPLWAQIFRKVCFHEQKYDFWPISTCLTLLKGPPNIIFENLCFFDKFRGGISKSVKGALTSQKSYFW